jgi:putative oxidoreductase
MRSKIFCTRVNPLNVDIVLVLARLVVGYAFILHGVGKIQHPLNWMGDQSPVPGVLQALAAISEFGGGIALILGLLTRVGAFGIACTMAVAVFMHRFVMGDPFVNATGGKSYEPAAVFFVFALMFIVLGPGRFSLDRVFFGNRQY